MTIFIGIDFDNTIALYDRVAGNVASELGFASMEPGRPIKGLRDHLRTLPGGEDKWRHVQAAIYGPRIGEAEVASGAEAFFRKCKQRGVPVAIVSHKTQFADKGEGDVDLRSSALSWMKDRSFFKPDGFDVDESAVFFETTRRSKIGRIRSLGCTHFIDDLPEVFEDDEFPSGTEKLLYSPSGGGNPVQEAQIFECWRDIARHIFHD